MSLKTLREKVYCVYGVDINPEYGGVWLVESEYLDNEWEQVMNNCWMDSNAMVQLSMLVLTM